MCFLYLPWASPSLGSLGVIDFLHGIGTLRWRVLLKIKPEPFSAAGLRLSPNHLFGLSLEGHLKSLP